VAVVTTSGTAVAELYPAVMEAFYAGLPLLIVSADRPKNFRGKGAPQSIEQVGVFSHYVKEINAVDWDDKTQDFTWTLSADSASQMNVCFKEPLIDRDLKPLELSAGEISIGTAAAPSDSLADMGAVLKDFFKKSRNPVVVVGELPAATASDRRLRDAAIDLLLEINQPVYLEAHSGLREIEKLSALRIQAGDKFLASKEVTAYFDGIIRIGSVPTVRLWRDLEDRLAAWPVLSFSHRPFSGLSRIETQPLDYATGFEMLRQELSGLKAYQELQEIQRDKFLSRDSEMYLKLKELFEKFPLAEPSLIHEMSVQFERPTKLFVGNSLPIREWDLAANYNIESTLEVAGNRGVNGIDGLISTFLGWAEEKYENVILLGDLSTLYDLAGLWPATQNYCASFKIAIINNSGGKIFKPMFKDTKFENQHSLEFSNWAKMFSVNYACVTSTEQLKPAFAANSHNKVIEIRPDEKQTQEFWANYDQLISGLSLG
ncbi:MAG: thiamine pyrophosphate-binding protein, partial [Bdellovibrionota bacterium]